MTQKLIPSKRFIEVEGMEMIYVLRMYEQLCWTKNNDLMHAQCLILLHFLLFPKLVNRPTQIDDKSILLYFCIEIGWRAYRIYIWPALTQNIPFSKIKYHHFWSSNDKN